MKLNVSDVLLGWLSDLRVLKCQLWAILDEESHEDGAVLPICDVVTAYKGIEKHGDCLDLEQIVFYFS